MFLIFVFFVLLVSFSFLSRSHDLGGFFVHSKVSLIGFDGESGYGLYHFECT